MAKTPASPQIKPCFGLGKTCSTPGALELFRRYQVDPLSLLARHVTGDWGDVCVDDAQVNDEALLTGARIFSVYLLKPPAGAPKSMPTAKVWLITEADRSVTTFLLPEEY